MKRYSERLVCITLTALLISCSVQKPVRIGLLAPLSGPTANIGIEARIAALLALDDFQKTNGKIPIEIIEYNDRGSAIYAQIGAKELIDEGVVAIIGAFTSQTTIAAMSETEKAAILLLSPTAANSSLVGQDDHLVRLNNTSKQSGALYAERMATIEQLDSVTIIGDISNNYYTLDWIRGFQNHLQEFPDSRIVQIIKFNSHEEDFTPEAISLRAITSETDAIVIIADSFPTALIVQQIRKHNQDVILYASDWAVGTYHELIAHGGSAINGLIVLSTLYEPASRDVDYLNFAERFSDRFGKEPNPLAISTYDAFSIVFQTLAKGVKKEDLVSAVIKGGPYKGIQKTIELDEYGDIVTYPHFYVIGGESAF